MIRVLTTSRGPRLLLGLTKPDIDALFSGRPKLVELGPLGLGPGRLMVSLAGTAPSLADLRDRGVTGQIDLLAVDPAAAMEAAPAEFAHVPGLPNGCSIIYGVDEAALVRKAQQAGWLPSAKRLWTETLKLLMLAVVLAVLAAAAFHKGHLGHQLLGGLMVIGASVLLLDGWQQCRQWRRD